MRLYFPLLVSLIGPAIAATPAQWRSQSIYFMLTDRFARTDESTTASCDTKYGVSPDEIHWIPCIVAKFLPEILRRYMEGYREKGTSSSYSLFTWINIKRILVGLYPGNGIHRNLDHSNYHSDGRKHCRWFRLPWVLAAGHVSSTRTSPFRQKTEHLTAMVSTLNMERPMICTLSSQPFTTETCTWWSTLLPITWFVTLSFHVFSSN